ncbi:MAG: FtsH protease modulator HflK [Pseudomonadota bacterium]|jgi:membrane protease subunit HflK
MPKSFRNIFSLNDPGWGRGGGDSKPPPKGDGPPDLDELWRDFNRKLNGMFKRRPGGPGGPTGPGGGIVEPPSMKGAGIGLAVIGVAGLLLWMGSGFYIVPEGHQSAVLRFGEYKQLVDRAGITWRMPYPIESHEIVNAQQLRQIEVGYRNTVRNKTLREALMLTTDQSIVDLQFALQFRIGDARAFLFNNNFGVGPEDTVRQAAETAMREVVGRRTIDQVLYEEKEQVAKDVRLMAQGILDRYQSGITLVDVTIQQAQPPDQVQDAFEDANKAAQDRERLINEGQAYANDVIPKARGTAARLGEEAEGYKQRVIATAEGDASRFSQIHAEYAKAPRVTRDRMYIDAMQQVFSNVSKVYVDTQGGVNLLSLPLDRLLRQGGVRSDATRMMPSNSSGPAAGVESGSSNPAPVSRTDGLRNRDRDAR